MEQTENDSSFQKIQELNSFGRMNFEFIKKYVYNNIYFKSMKKNIIRDFYLF